MAPIDSESMGAPRFGSYSRTDDRRKKSFQGVKFDIAPFNICSTSKIANIPFNRLCIRTGQTAVHCTTLFINHDQINIDCERRSIFREGKFIYMTLSKIRVTKKSQFSFYKSLGGSDGLQKLFNIPKSSLELNNYEFVRKKMVSRM